MLCVQAVDEAKKRAVLQRVDYETFKNMVLVAHLKPIHAPNERQNGESTTQAPPAAWSSLRWCTEPTTGLHAWL